MESNSLKPTSRPWLTPIVVLAVLFLLMATRWDYNATIIGDDYVIKWKTDRWSGDRWKEVYTSYGGFDETPGDAWADWNTRSALDAVSWLAVYFTLGWLGWGLYRTKRPKVPRKRKQESGQSAGG